MGVKVKYHRGAWWVFVHHKGKRSSIKVGTDKARAEAIAEDMRDALVRGEIGLRVQARADTLANYGAHWLEQQRTLKASTARFYRDNLKNHLVPVLGTIPVCDIERTHVKALLAALTKKKLRPRTVTGVIRTLSTILSEAVEDGHLSANPALRPGRLRKALRDPNEARKTPLDPYSREEAEAILGVARAVGGVWYPYVLCALRTGMRLGETRALRWGDIDWRQRFIAVGRNYVEGKFTTTKSGHQRRVDLSNQLRSELRLWRRRLRTVWLAKGKPAPALVFPNEAGEPLDDSKMRRVVRRIVTKAEVRIRPRILHVFRHTFCSLLVQQGESLVYVKEQAGHSTITVTAGYAHFAPGGNRGAVDKLDAIGGGK
jgi:integrase